MLGARKPPCHPPPLLPGRRPPPPPRWGRWLPGGLALLAAWVALWDRLRIDWSVNDQYAYGWFVPPLAVALFALRWRDQPAAQPPAGASKWVLALAVGVGLALLLPVRLIEEPNGDWRLMEWAHALVLAGVTLGVLAWCGGWRWAWHFAFPVGFLLLALRWPSGLEHALIQGLQQHVAHLTAVGMTTLGIPAEQAGNLIRVRDQTVGVNEACSGIRSLQTVWMASLFLGELSRMSWGRRAALVAGGVVVALAANVFRSSLLVWIAAGQGTAALERFHDTAGVSVLVIVFIGLLVLNSWLERPAAGKNGESDRRGPRPGGGGREGCAGEVRAGDDRVAGGGGGGHERLVPAARARAGVPPGVDGRVADRGARVQGAAGRRREPGAVALRFGALRALAHAGRRRHRARRLARCSSSAGSRAAPRPRWPPCTSRRRVCPRAG